MMKTREAIRKRVIKWLMAISYKETNYLYKKGKLDYENYMNRITYPQTWWMRSHIPIRVLWRRWWNYKGKVRHNPLYIYVIVEKLCGLLTGHETSNTEYGYGGGKYIDRNCRWCDKVILEPIEESEWAQSGEWSDMIAQMQNGTPICECRECR